MGSLSAKLTQPRPLPDTQPAMRGSQGGLYSAPSFRLPTSHLVIIGLHGNPFSWKWQWFVSPAITHTGSGSVFAEGIPWPAPASNLPNWVPRNIRSEHTQAGTQEPATQGPRAYPSPHHSGSGNLLKRWKSLLKAQVKCRPSDLPHGAGMRPSR